MKWCKVLVASSVLAVITVCVGIPAVGMPAVGSTATVGIPAVGGPAVGSTAAVGGPAVGSTAAVGGPAVGAGVVVSSTVSGDALICAELGILRGDTGVVDPVYLAKTTTRLQAIYITVRLLGKESAAMTHKGTPNFSDAEVVGDAGGRRVLAYVKARRELGWQGAPDGSIMPRDFVTPQAMYKVLLASLGYTVNTDYAWDDTVSFASSLGMSAMSGKRGFLTNNDLAKMLVEALKTRLNGSEQTLCEYLESIGVIDGDTASVQAMLPGSPGFTPILSYNDGGPLLTEVLNIGSKQVSIRFNTAINPTYAKSFRCYSYFMPGNGYMPLPSRCSTSTSGDNTIVIKFPEEGWMAYSGDVQADAFEVYIASERRRELRISGLVDVDGNPLPDIMADVPPLGGFPQTELGD